MKEGERDPIGFSATEARRPRDDSLRAWLLIFPLHPHFLKKAEFGIRLGWQRRDFGAADDRTFTN